MSAATPNAPVPLSATPICPPWCDSHHVNPEVEDHVCLVDAVHREPRLESVAVELEQAPNAPQPLLVLSLFTKEKKPKAMSAGLTIDQARHAHTALGEALRLASKESDRFECRAANTDRFDNNVERESANTWPIRLTR